MCLLMDSKQSTSRLEWWAGCRLEKIHVRFWFSREPCHRCSLLSLPVPVAVCRAPELEFGVLGVLSFKNYFFNYWQFALCPSSCYSYGWVHLPGGWDRRQPWARPGALTAPKPEAPPLPPAAIPAGWGTAPPRSWWPLCQAAASASDAPACWGQQSDTVRPGSDRAATREAAGEASTGVPCPSAGITVPTGEVWCGMDPGARGRSRICHSPKPFPAGGPLWLEHVLCSDFSQCKGPAQDPFQPLHTWNSPLPL